MELPSDHPFMPGFWPPCHWALDESSGTTAADSAGGNSGALSGGVTWQPAGGKIAGSLEFDGVDGLINAGSASGLDNLGALTVSAWIYPQTIGENGAGWIIGKASGTDLPTNGWILALSRDAAKTIKFAVDHSSSHIEHTGTTNAITLNAWNHVVVTWTGATGAGNNHIYINNVEIGYSYTDNGSGARASDASQNISIGNNPATSRTFDGLIDDVRLYNRVLSGSEMSTLYNGGAGCQ